MQIVEFATRRRVTILMVTVAIVLFGFVSLTRLKLNLLPDLSYPTLTVRTDLPGAAPLELETLRVRQCLQQWLVPRRTGQRQSQGCVKYNGVGHRARERRTFCHGYRVTRPCRQ